MEGVVLGVVLLYDTGGSPKSIQPDHAAGERLEHIKQYIYFNDMFLPKKWKLFSYLGKKDFERNLIQYGCYTGYGHKCLVFSLSEQEFDFRIRRDWCGMPQVLGGMDPILEL